MWVKIVGRLITAGILVLLFVLFAGNPPALFFLSILSLFTFIGWKLFRPRAPHHAEPRPKRQKRTRRQKRESDELQNWIDALERTKKK
jgi:hypothetical protein